MIEIMINTKRAIVALKTDLVGGSTDAQLVISMGIFTRAVS